MKLETINPYVMKILISARKQDSISSISKRIGLSYGWTHKWVGELIKEGIFEEKWRGINLKEDNQKYKEILRFLKQNLDNTSFYYSVLSLFGIEYCFTKTDAVYFWTEGKYNLARYRDYYPIFIKIKKADYPLFLEYCRKLGLNVNSGKGIFYSPEIMEEIKSSKKKTSPVDSLNDTINFMKKNIYNFQPALEMIQEMYNKKLKVSYKEVNNF
jgi:transposase